MRLGLVTGWMFYQERRQANRFLAQIPAHQFIALRRLVAFVKQQVQSLQNCIQSFEEFGPSWYFECNLRFSNVLPRPHESLCDRDARGKEGSGEFLFIEAA